MRPSRVINFWLQVVLAGREEPNPVLLPEALIQWIAVVGAVANHSFWFGSRETLHDGGFDEFAFMKRSAGDAAGDRKTMAVCDRRDFTAFSSARRADSSAPFFAGLKLASMAGLTGGISIRLVASMPTSTVGTSFRSKQRLEFLPLQRG